MLDIYLFEPDKVHREIVREICTAYSIKRNTEFSFIANAIIPEQIGCSDGYKSETAIYIIKGDKCVKTLSVSIVQLNAENYTVLIADSLEEILSYISAEFSPAGILMKPAEYSAAEKIFDDIYMDFKKSYSAGGRQFRFKVRSREYSVGTNSILYFEASNKKTVLRTAGQAFEFYMPFEEILKNLPDNFVRTHKSFIANTNHIAVADYKNMSAELDDGSVIYISRTYKENLQSAMAEK